MNKKNRGVSTVVATVMIILVTVAAVTVVWIGIIPMVRDKLDSAKVCMSSVSQLLLLNKGYTCRSSDGENVSIHIKHSAESFDLSDIQVLFSSGGDTVMFNVMNDTTTLIPLGVNIPLPGENEERVYVIDTSSVSGVINEVQIAPVLAVGSDDRICDISSSQTLLDC